MKVVLAQIDIRLNRTNLERHIEIIKEHGDCDVIVFPELSLSGYMLQDKVYEDAYTLEELKTLEELSKNIDIAVGAAIRVDEKILNAALYYSNGELVHNHNKMHLPNYGMFEEARFYSKGSSLESFETKHGLSCMVVCEDLWRANVIADISSLQVKILYVLSNSPARDFTNDGLKISQQWQAILKTTAMLSHCHVVFVNRVGFEDGLGFWGGSLVVSPQGEIENSFDLFEENIEAVKLDHALHSTEKLIIKHD